MLDAVMATYSGDNVFILDEETPFAQGQRVMIAAIEPKTIDQKKKIDLHRYSGSAGNLFGRTERVQNEGIPFREKTRTKSSAGILAKYANPDLIPLEQSAWAEAAEEKYGEKVR